MNKITLGIMAAAALMLPFVASSQDDQAGLKKKDSYRFVIIPKVVHPWFDKVNNGAKQAAAVIKAQTGSDVQIIYSAPQQADVVLQNQILESSIATRPDGIAIDLLDEKGNRASLEEAVGQKIPVTIFDSVAPADMNLTSIGNDFCEQAQIASRRLAELLNGKGEVAIMMGVPSAPNHAIRADCHQKTFATYPGIKVVATGIDNDDIETAQKQAAAIMQAHPNLKGWVASDAAGPIGIGQAIKEANKAHQVLMVGLDDLTEMLQLIRDGVADSTSSTKPEMQGYWAVMTMWQKAMGIPTPKYIDTGIAIINKDNVGK
ncbi:substrate-binding domain-containing protein [Sodalis ligni]|jgi:ribose transport system substrate-binding protein|uniref:Ribose transport system substrate-binding protein n=1 Tax=Sodalis ligni TaxID=2697027 RepID=A0A4R1N7Y5_9GAMM|nr:substrate-binding domain-containing protein [Sodalis ligni]QWA13153.1 substrate-binding domain-containing protein [Sodalis ligni]TCL03303.1 ribose transport system substrate-binding protein [Sodalis ligni]